MIFFNTDYPEKKLSPKVGQWHLVKLDSQCPADYAVAKWTGEIWEDFELEEISEYVTAFACIEQ